MVPGEPELTVAVKVTLWPDTDGLIDDTTATVVAAGATVWPPVSVPALELKFASPL
jgi:hypothetical protein